MIWNNIEIPDKPYYQDDAVIIYNADCRDILPQISGISSVITDPPYELGFMGKEWDKSGVAYDLKVWQGCFNALKSGGYLLSFGGARTYHRMACAIEDAGFEIRDMVEWIYGSGFPKSLDISKAIDKEKGVYVKGELLPSSRTTGASETGIATSFREKTAANPQSAEAKEWAGWGTALKPAHEPICMARKPLSEKTVAENVLKYGTGGINIDECRVSIDPKIDDPRLGGKGDWSSDKMAKNVYEGGYAGVRTGSSPLGRFPANLIHDGSEEVLEIFPDSKTARIEKPSDCSVDGITSFESMRGNRPARGYDGEGSAARFFYCAKASRGERDEGCENIELLQTDTEYRPNDDGSKGLQSRLHGATIKGHNNHPTVKPLTLMKYLITLETPLKGIILDPFCGSGTTLLAGKQLGYKIIGIDADEKSCEIAAKRCSQAVELRMF